MVQQSVTRRTSLRTTSGGRVTCKGALVIAVPPRALVVAYAAFRRERRLDDELTDNERRFPSLADPAFALNGELSRRVRPDGGTKPSLLRVPGSSR